VGGQPSGVAADTDARTIAKGRLGRRGVRYKAQVTDNTQGIVLDHIVEKGNPPMRPCSLWHRRITKLFGKCPGGHR